MHALAQLPDDLATEISCDDAERGRLELLACAYGIRARALSSSVAPAAKAEIAEPESMAALVEQFWRPADFPASSEKDDRPLRRQRIGLVTNMPAPYRIPLFNGLADRLHGVDAEFRAFFLSEGSHQRSWMHSNASRAFDHEIVQSIELPLYRGALICRSDLPSDFAHFAPTWSFQAVSRRSSPVGWRPCRVATEVCSVFGAANTLRWGRRRAHSGARRGGGL